MKKPNILMFAPYAYPAVGPESIVTNKLLVAMRYADVTIETISWGNSESVYPYNNHLWMHIADQIIPIHVQRIHLLNRFNKIINVPAIKNIISGILWSISAYKVGLEKSKTSQYSMVISRCRPFWGHLPALKFAQKFKLPWIACWNDPHIDRIIPAPYGKEDNKVPYFIKQYITATGRYADWHVFPCERLRNFMMRFFPYEVLQKSSVIPHIALTRLRKKAKGTMKAFSICYAGTIDRFRNPAVFFLGVKRFLEKGGCNDLSITFLGRVEDFCNELIHRNGLESIVSIRDSMSYEELPEFQSTFAVLLIIEAPCREGIFLPSKFVDYVQIGRPILAISPKSGTINDILSHHGGGIAADVNSPEDVAKALNILYEHWKAGTLDESYSSDRLFPLFDEEHVLSEYLKIFNIIRQQKAHKNSNLLL